MQRLLVLKQEHDVRSSVVLVTVFAVRLTGVWLLKLPSASYKATGDLVSLLSFCYLLFEMAMASASQAYKD